ncbi:MAG: AbrB/MazE/SpoVT family DNA-binding domain-containing protein [Candidatus Bathyarchaeota archaeon]|nr:AbrB/MazE/SpoVT family DNA-binding domain-containing protein [Candidatus Bathyarchaeota archaeon]MDI6806125.1 AbrB/MazE/SpoVT family DNA-binding domain-containing protein [Candidatus Bathyarchaeia archaeon]
MGKIKMDERGRVLIPSQKREQLRLKPGTEFELIEEKGTLVLKPVIPKPLRVQSKKQDWDKEAFLNAGEATFGD